MTGVGPGDNCLIVWKLYVVPEMQGAGVGSALLSQVVEAARNADERTIRLEYVEGNTRAAAFYAAKGFTETDRQVDPNGGPASVWMELAL